jgi:hypothetical protein
VAILVFFVEKESAAAAESRQRHALVLYKDTQLYEQLQHRNRHIFTQAANSASGAWAQPVTSPLRNTFRPAY